MHRALPGGPLGAEAAGARAAGEARRYFTRGNDDDLVPTSRRRHPRVSTNNSTSPMMAVSLAQARIIGPARARQRLVITRRGFLRGLPGGRR